MRTFKWPLSIKWLDPSQEKDWERNPKGSISAYHLTFVSFWNKRYGNSDLVATLDGSWSSCSKKGGISGIIKDNNKRMKVLFSGPISTTDSFSTELKVLKHVLSIWANSYLSSCSIVIFTDSKQLVEEFEEFFTLHKRDSRTGLMLTDLNLNPLGLCLKHINRRFNHEAHDLAKKGRILRPWDGIGLLLRILGPVFKSPARLINFIFFIGRSHYQVFYFFIL